MELNKLKCRHILVFKIGKEKFIDVSKLRKLLEAKNIDKESLMKLIKTKNKISVATEVLSAKEHQEIKIKKQ
jgi:hypothetical protein